MRPTKRALAAPLPAARSSPRSKRNKVNLSLVAPVTSPGVTAVAALRGMPTDQLIESAIARLRAALPERASVLPVESPKFHIIQVPPSIRGRS